MDGSDNQGWNPNIGSQNKKVLQMCIYALGKCCYPKHLTFAFKAYVFINSHSLGIKMSKNKYYNPAHCRNDENYGVYDFPPYFYNGFCGLRTLFLDSD